MKIELLSRRGGGKKKEDLRSCKRRKTGGQSRDGDGNGGFMDSRLLDRDKIQIALLFCHSVLFWPFAAPLTGLKTDPLTPPARTVISVKGGVAGVL